MSKFKLSLALLPLVIVAVLGLSYIGNLLASSSIVTSDLSGVTTATDLVNTLLGGTSPPIVSNITYTGDPQAAGTFSGGTGIVGFESGVILSSGKVASVVGPNTSDAMTTDFGNPGDADLNGLIPGYTTFDAALLEFDFECEVSQVVSFQYVFTSEEYNEWVSSPYNNVFGFFLNGVNIALLPDGVTPISINNVNNGANAAYYIDNDYGDFYPGPYPVDIEADGLTVVLGAQALINPGLNHIKFAIADAGDRILDSWVFIQAGSFECAPLGPGEVVIDIKPGSDPNSINPNSKGTIPVAILSSANFDAPNQVDKTSLTFGRTGDEPSLAFCNKSPEDVNNDGLLDQVCHFKTQLTGFQKGDTVGILKGMLNGTPFVAQDSVQIVPK